MSEQMSYIDNDTNKQCLTPDHLVLTIDGWLPISQVTTEHKVAQWDQQAYTISFVNPTGVISKKHEGVVYHFTSSANNIDQVVTGDHRLPVIRRATDNGAVVRTFAYAKYIELDSDVAIPTNGYLKELGSTLSLEEQIYVAIHCIGEISETDRDDVVCYKVSTKSELKYNALTDALYKLGWGYKIWTAGAQDANEGKVIYVYIPKKLLGYNLKTYNWVSVNKLTREWSQDFIGEVRFWSLNRKTDKGTQYVVLDESSVDVISTVAYTAGDRVHVKSTLPDGKYEISFTDEAYVVGSNVQRKQLHYSGQVYGLKVPSSFFIVRRNSIISITGSQLETSTNTPA